MNLATSFRLTRAWWLLMVLFGFAVFVGLSNASPENGYVTAEYAAASRLLVLVGPVLAVGVCLVFVEVRQATVARRPTRRTISWLFPLWPLLLGGPLVGVAGMLSATRAFPDEVAAYRVLGVVALTLLGCCAVGILGGRLLPPAVAVPVVGLGVYAWLALPGSGSNVTLRNINSAFVGCCSADTAPATSLVLGSTAFSAVLVIGALACCSWRAWWRAPRRVAVLVPVLVLALAPVVAVGAAHAPSEDLNLLGIQNRTTPTTCTPVDNPTDTQTHVCVWPEHGDLLVAATTAVGDANRALDAAGLSPLTKVSESKGDEATQFAVEAPLVDYIKFSLAQGMITQAVECDHPFVTSTYGEVLAYLSFLFGLDHEMWESSGYSPAAFDAARDLASRSREEQRAFVAEGMAAIKTSCAGT